MKHTRIRLVVCVGLILFAGPVLAQQPDLLILQAKVSSALGPNLGIVAGDLAHISVDLRNTGTLSASDVIARLYEGDPAQDAPQIGDDQLMEELPVGVTQRVVWTWNTLGKAGYNELYVLIDPENQITEPNEDNNTYVLAFDVFLVGDFNCDGRIGLADRDTLTAALGTQEGDRDWNLVCDIWAEGEPVGVAPHFAALRDGVINDADALAFNALMDLDLLSEAASVSFDHADHVVFKPAVEEAQYDFAADYGDSIRIRVAVPTVGEAEVGELVVRFLDNGEPIGEEHFSRSDGGTGIAYCIWQTDGLEPGMHQITVIADPDDQKAESSEDNNTIWKAVLLKPTAVLQEDFGAQPTQFEVFQNFPNPFNPTTTISFSIPASDPGPSHGKPERVCTLAVYDLTGKLVRSLVQGSVHSGAYQVVWDGKDASGRQVASGIYFYRLDLGRGQQSSPKKMILLR